jgi:hypothetical protein
MRKAGMTVMAEWPEYTGPLAPAYVWSCKQYAGHEDEGRLTWSTGSLVGAACECRR